MVCSQTRVQPNLLYWKRREAGEPTKIMVVDDERLIADMFATILNYNGYRALPLYGAEEAIEHARMIRFDLALLGVCMPGMHGVNAGILIRHLQRRCKVVLWVEDIPVELRTLADAYGFDHVPLPIPHTVFIRRINGLVP